MDRRTLFGVLLLLVASGCREPAPPPYATWAPSPPPPVVTGPNAFDAYTLESFGKDGIDGANMTYATRNDFYLDMVIRDGLFIASPE